MEDNKMSEYIERGAALALVKPDAPEDEKAAVTIATCPKHCVAHTRRRRCASGVWAVDSTTLEEQ